MQEMTWQSTSLRLYLTLVGMMQYLATPFMQMFDGSESAGKTQKNAYVWVIVFVFVVAAYFAACALIDKEFTGEIKFLGMYVKVKCV